MLTQVESETLAGHLSAIQSDLRQNTAEVSKLAERVGVQNGRLKQVEIDLAVSAALAKEQERHRLLMEEERERRLIEANEQRRQDAEARERRFRWLLGFGLTGAGVLSGIVFSVLTLVVK